MTSGESNSIAVAISSRSVDQSAPSVQSVAAIEPERDRCRAEAILSPVDFATALGVRFDIESRRDEVDTVVNSHRSAMSAEKRARARFPVEQTPHRKGDGFSLVAVC